MAAPKIASPVVVSPTPTYSWSPTVSMSELAQTPSLSANSFSGYSGSSMGTGNSWNTAVADATNTTNNTNLATSFNSYSEAQLNSLYDTFLKQGGVPDQSYAGLSDTAKAEYLTKGMQDLKTQQGLDNSSWFSTNNMNKVNTGLQAASTLVNAYIGFENLGLAKDQYNLQKKSIESQLAFLREDRARADSLRATSA